MASVRMVPPMFWATPSMVSVASTLGSLTTPISSTDCSLLMAPKKPTRPRHSVIAATDMKDTSSFLPMVHWFFILRLLECDPVLALFADLASQIVRS